MATVPEKLEDRLIVVSREEYVRIGDDNPGALRSRRVTIVPVPLLGQWQEFDELHDINLIVGHAYISERAAMGGDGDSKIYIPDMESFDAVAKVKSRLVLGVCQALGATSLDSVEISAQTDESSVRDHLETEIGQSVTRKRKPRKDAEKDAAISERLEFSADLVSNVRKRYIAQMETKGKWQGGPPSIADARRIIAGYDPAMVDELLTLIAQRESQDNPVTEVVLDGTLTSQLSRDFDLLAQAARTLEGALGPAEFSATSKLSNKFELRKSQASETRFRLRVHFGAH